MLKFESLTNVRPTKDLGCQVIAAPTKGQIKVTPDAADALDVRVGDYVQLVKADGVVYAVKGEKGVGSKLAASNKTGAGILTLSSAMSWDSLNGDENSNVHFNLNVEGAVEQEGRTYFPLNFVESVAKQQRKKSSTNEVADVTSPAPTETANAEQDFGSEFEDM